MQRQRYGGSNRSGMGWWRKDTAYMLHKYREISCTLSSSKLFFILSLYAPNWISRGCAKASAPGAAVQAQLHPNRQPFPMKANRPRSCRHLRSSDLNALDLMHYTSLDVSINGMKKILPLQCSLMQVSDNFRCDFSGNGLPYNSLSRLESMHWFQSLNSFLLPSARTYSTRKA